MTHYQDAIEPYLHETYGAENVHREYKFDTDRRVDFMVDVGDVRLAIEVENTTDETVEKGFGQARLYARHENRAVPVVYYQPDDDASNEAELSLIEEEVVLVPFDFEAGEPI